MLEVQFTFQACEDLSAIWDSIAEDSGAWHSAVAVNKAAADTFATRLQHHVEILASNPEVSQARDELLHGLRSSTLDRYALYFRVRSNTLEVLRVMVQPNGAAI